MKIKDFALMAGMYAALGTNAPDVDFPKKVGFKKSQLPPKEYKRRQKRNRMARKSRQINRKIKRL